MTRNAPVRSAGLLRGGSPTTRENRPRAEHALRSGRKRACCLPAVDDMWRRRQTGRASEPSGSGAQPFSRGIGGERRGARGSVVTKSSIIGSAGAGPLHPSMETGSSVASGRKSTTASQHGALAARKLGRWSGQVASWAWPLMDPALIPLSSHVFDNPQRPRRPNCSGSQEGHVPCLRSPISGEVHHHRNHRVPSARLSNRRRFLSSAIDPRSSGRPKNRPAARGLGHGPGRETPSCFPDASRFLLRTGRPHQRSWLDTFVGGSRTKERARPNLYVTSSCEYLQLVVAPRTGFRRKAVGLRQDHGNFHHHRLTSPGWDTRPWRNGSGYHLPPTPGETSCPRRSGRNWVGHGTGDPPRNQNSGQRDRPIVECGARAQMGA